MPKTARPTVGFSFQEIPLEEAVNVILAGDGNYSEIKQTLLQKLPTLAPDMAFAFGLPNGEEIDERHRRGLCMAMNMTLKKAGLAWRVTYSGIKKLFLCVPRSAPRTYQKRAEVYIPKSKHNKLDDSKIIELWKAGKSATDIIEETGAPKSRVHYICYTLYPRKKNKALRPPINGQIPDSQAMKEMEGIIAKASKLFNVTPQQIMQKGSGGHGRTVRKAICVVATQRKIVPRIVAPYVGISKGGVQFNAHHDTRFGKKEVAELQAALGR